MATLIVKIIATDADSDKELILAERRSSSYSPDILDQAIINLIENVPKEKLKHVADVQVVVILNADDVDQVRPAFNLSADAITKLHEIGASLDFDPYV